VLPVYTSKRSARSPDCGTIHSKTAFLHRAFGTATAQPDGFESHTNAVRPSGQLGTAEDRKEAGRP